MSIFFNGTQRGVRSTDGATGGSNGAGIAGCNPTDQSDQREQREVGFLIYFNAGVPMLSAGYR